MREVLHLKVTTTTTGEEVGSCRQCPTWQWQHSMVVGDGDANDDDGESRDLIGKSNKFIESNMMSEITDSIEFSSQGRMALGVNDNNESQEEEEKKFEDGSSIEVYSRGRARRGIPLIQKNEQEEEEPEEITMEIEGEPSNMESNTSWNGGAMVSL